MSSTRLSSANKPLLQGLPPILPDGKIKALILGSFPSVASLEAQQYYAHPQNHFWRVLEHCGIIESATADYATRVAQVQAADLAIWDLYKEVTRQGSGDDQIRNEAPNDIETLLQERSPFPILLNGRRQREWKRHFGHLDAEAIPLPSTSPRPLHWNTGESRYTAIEEWCHALSARYSAALTVELQ